MDVVCRQRRAFYLFRWSGLGVPHDAGKRFLIVAGEGVGQLIVCLVTKFWIAVMVCVSLNMRLTRCKNSGHARSQ